MGEPRKINTAPKDGTEIFAFNSYVGWWRTSYDNGNWPLGYWRRFGEWFPVPTHWMPLDDLPSPK